MNDGWIITTGSCQARISRRRESLPVCYCCEVYQCLRKGDRVLVRGKSNMGVGELALPKGFQGILACTVGTEPRWGQHTGH